jgi:hypothetical protein
MDKDENRIYISMTRVGPREDTGQSLVPFAYEIMKGSSLSCYVEKKIRVLREKGPSKEQIMAMAEWGILTTTGSRVKRRVWETVNPTCL